MSYRHSRWTPHPADQPDTHSLVRGRARVGEFELTILSDGPYLLDGGAMFGVVPKTLWQRRTTPDAENRVLLGLNTVLVRDGKRTYVIETGIGNKLGEKLRGIYSAQESLMDAFVEANVRPEEVELVINSHLHFDHCGWNTRLNEAGVVVPTFANARYFAHRGEVEHGRLQLERDAISYRADNYEPLIASGQMTLLDTRPGELVEIATGLTVELYPGHTAQMMAIHIDSCGEHAVYISDLIPTSAHLDVTWGMGYDLDPLSVIRERKRFYARAIENNWLVLFTHDHHRPFARIGVNEKGRPALHAADAPSAQL